MASVMIDQQRTDGRLSTGTFNLGPIGQIPIGEGREFEVHGRLVAVFHARDGRLYATQASCPHLGGKLADGVVGGAQVICPLHAYRYDLRDGGALNSACDALQTFPVWVMAGGDMIVQLQA
ncbi:MAG TPA: Rieske 2Fe-2S domain-containing protein [Chloroflexota bacterium]|nr:Rieske 2Fe-2S domain-containing protein [Chloroflexota bacterium]